MWPGAAAAVGPGEAELVEGVVAAWRGLRLSWRWGLSWKDEPQKWQKRRMRKMKWRKQKGVCGEFLRMMLSWQKNSHCWSCFWYLSQLRKMTRRRMRRNRGAG